MRWDFDRINRIYRIGNGEKKNKRGKRMRGEA
jgi:hypothetical protein